MLPKKNLGLSVVMVDAVKVMSVASAFGNMSSYIPLFFRHGSVSIRNLARVHFP